MKVEIFTLCDAATDQQGKLNLLGTFDQIGARSMPVRHPACAVACRIRFSKLEEGDHKFKLSFSNADGKPVVPPLEGKFPVRMPPEALTQARNLVINLQSLEFREFGDFSINLHVDGKLMASLPLYVREVKAPAV